MLRHGSYAPSQRGYDRGACARGRAICTSNCPGPSATPIEHLVDIFQESNVVRSLFRNLPLRDQPAGRAALHGPPRVNGFNETRLHSNPNSVAPFRLDRNIEIRRA
jgi:hypothetical protein